MIVEAQVTINGSKAAIWAAITNIENASETISGIENIEVLEQPATGLVGLKLRETRMLFGKPATGKSGSLMLLRTSSTKPEQKVMDLYSYPP